MKLKILFMTLTFAAAVPVFAAGRTPSREDVTLTGLSLAVRGDSLRVYFRARIGSDVTSGRDYKVTLRPVLFGSGQERALRSIEIHGRRVEILEARHGVRTPHVAGLPSTDLRQPAAGALRARAGETVEYSASLPLEEWMPTAGLRIERERSGCCRTERLAAVEAAPQSAPRPVLSPAGVASRARELAAASGAVTTGDSLARSFGFVEPLSALEARMNTASAAKGLFDPDMELNMGYGTAPSQQAEIDRYIFEGEKGALTVHFRQGKHLLERHFRDNNTMLVNLVSGIRMLQESKTSRVVRVVIVGSASPEGTLAFNDRLAWNRAVALKEFLLRNTAFPADSLSLFNGSEDWRGLRKLVAASDLYEREEILHIIDNVPVTQGRELELMKLSGGRPYLYMLENMFPELRNAAFIKVYYENVPDPAADALATGAALVSQGRYAEALTVLRGAAEGSGRDLLEGSARLFSGDEAGAVPLLERAAAGGEAEARTLLERLRSATGPRTFDAVELPGRK